MAGPRRYEIMLTRRVNPSDSVQVRVLPKAICWRCYSEAKGRSPWISDCELWAARDEVNGSDGAEHRGSDMRRAA